MLLIAGGIALAQAVSDPRQVTLRWLRLGGILAVTLIALAGTSLAISPVFIHVTPDDPLVHGGFWALIAGTGAVAQLLTVQRALRETQRLMAIGSFLLIVLIAGRLATAAVFTPQHRPEQSLAWVTLTFLPSLALSAGLVGGFLMTMLLGHAYLTAGSEMTQKPFARLVRLLAVLLVLRLGTSILWGLWPYQSVDVARGSQMWNMLMILTRYSVGLLAPAVFTYMIWDCVKRRSNQSATGILYVATVLVMIGEGLALGLLDATGLLF